MKHKRVVVTPYCAKSYCRMQRSYLAMQLLIFSSIIAFSLSFYQSNGPAKHLVARSSSPTSNKFHLSQQLRQHSHDNNQQKKKGSRSSSSFPLYAAFQSDSSKERKQQQQQQQQQVVNFYQILGIPQTATTKEIKQAYFRVAKQTHPDAVRRITVKEESAEEKESNTTSNNNIIPQLEFHDVSTAYKILSDPKERKKYDRAIRAQAFSDDVSKMATELAEQAYPSIYKAVDKIAVPFIRRTAATTLAAAAKFVDSTEAVSSSSPENTNNKTYRVSSSSAYSRDWKTAFKEAAEAARRAGKLVDGMELLEKYEKLEKRARESVDLAYKIKGKLDTVSKQRMTMILHAPNVTLTSSDALALLEHWGLSNESVNHLSIFDRDIWRHSIYEEIKELKVYEQQLLQTNAETRKTEIHLSKVKNEYNKAKNDVDMALRAEIAAQKALEAAQLRVKEANTKVDHTANLLSDAEIQTKKIRQERDKLFKQITRKQGQVQTSLRKKHQNVLQEQHVGGADDGSSATDLDFLSSTLNGNKKEITLSEMNKIREEEEFLSRDYTRLAEKAAQLLAKAHELREKAEEIEKQKP